jgi:hypothetical protein
MAPSDLDQKRHREPMSSDDAVDPDHGCKRLGMRKPLFVVLRKAVPFLP